MDRLLLMYLMQAMGVSVRLNLFLILALFSFVTVGCSDSNSVTSVSQDNTSVQSSENPINQYPNAKISYSLRMFEQ
jgi:hypothetical protein